MPDTFHFHRPSFGVTTSLLCSVIYHGSPGAFAHIACSKAFPKAQTIASGNLFHVVNAVRSGDIDAVVLPCENLLAGRVPDIHLLLPESGLAIVGEIFIPIELHLVAPPDCELGQIKRVHSHPVALKQIQRFLASHDLVPVEASNTATAAAQVRTSANRTDAAVASELAAELYDLMILKRNIEDNPTNMTRFYILAATPISPVSGQGDLLTSLLFEVKNTPGALFRAVRGFAENGINFTKLESYLVGGQFVATRFFCEFEGHPEMPSVRRALHALDQNTTDRDILGVFPVDRNGSRVREEEDAGLTAATHRGASLRRTRQEHTSG